MIRYLKLLCFTIACLAPAQPSSGNQEVNPKKKIAKHVEVYNWPIKPNVSVAQLLKAGASSYKFNNKPEMHAYIRELSKSYGLPYKLMRQILAVESNNCRYRHNKRTNDHGCFQISAITMKLYGWNQDTVSNNDLLNAHGAAIILKDLRKLTVGRLGDKWPCSYNVGLRKLEKSCNFYLAKLESTIL